MNEELLFDALGPKARARLRTASIGSAVLVGAVLAAMLAQLGHLGQLDAERWAILVDGVYLRFLLAGLWMTLLVGLVATAISASVGVLLALGRLSARRWVSLPTAAAIEFFRAMPLLLILFFAMFGLPMLGVRLPMFWQLVLAIVVHAGAIFAEIVRAGILAIGRGQSEAGQAIGLRPGQVMRYVVLPQALRALTPALIGQMVRVIKESSLGYVVGLAELLHSGQVLGDFTGYFIQAYAGVGVIYIVVNIALSRLAERLAERRRPTGGAVRPPRVLERV
jgi:glutamate transport system permease protein